MKNKLGTFRWLIFTIFGIIGLLGQFFGIVAVIILIGFLAHKALLFITFAVVYGLIDYWRHRSLVEIGYHPEIGSYKKDDKPMPNENTISNYGKLDEY